MKVRADELARMLRVLSVGTRVRIIELLKGRGLCVNALACRLKVTQGAVSQHLRVLRDAGLVVDEKRGYYVHYRLNEPALARWCEALKIVFETSSEADKQKKGNKKCAAAMKKKTNVKSRKI